jgi:hypothetical protein
MGTTLDTLGMKKQHKFFDKHLDNDLKSLSSYLLDIQDKVFSENIFNISEEMLVEYKKHRMGALTQLGIDKYNIFTFANPEIYNLKTALKELTIEACNYYDIDFESQRYLIHGWFNADQPTANNGKCGGVNPIKDPRHFHDHSDGLGAPWFHGYYCVDAEPSSTFYQIDRDPEKIFENINKNNRAILSETGHPHGRDDWFFDQQRITIAYDITPMANLIGVKPNIWMPL